MRLNTLLHERHLLEAVRRGTITQQQAEALLLLARTEEGGGGRLPDTSWLALVQAGVAGLVGVGAMVAATDHPYRHSGLEEMLTGLLAAALLFAGGFALRRVRSAEAPAAMLLAGAALQLVPIAHGFVRINEFGGRYTEGRPISFGVTLLGGLALWRLMRVGPALAVASLGLVGVVASTMREFFGLFGYRGEVMGFGVAGLLLLGYSVYTDRAVNSAKVDGAFWTSLCGAFSLSVSMCALIDRKPEGFFIALPLALAVGYFALRSRRRLLLIAAGGALLGLPAFAASEARLGDAATGAAFLLSAAGVGVAAHFARGALLAQAASGAADDDRSIWGGAA